MKSIYWIYSQLENSENNQRRDYLIVHLATAKVFKQISACFLFIDLFGVLLSLCSKECVSFSLNSLLLLAVIFGIACLSFFIWEKAIFKKLSKMKPEYKEGTPLKNLQELNDTIKTLDKMIDEMNGSIKFSQKMHDENKVRQN